MKIEISIAQTTKTNGRRELIIQGELQTEGTWTTPDIHDALLSTKVRANSALYTEELPRARVHIREIQ